MLMLAIFETVAVTLWLTKDNIFYLFNFSYIGLSISLGVFLFTGVFEAATIHYAVAKIFGPLVFGRDGADMPAGQQWYWIFCPIKFQEAQGRKSDGSEHNFCNLFGLCCSLILCKSRKYREKYVQGIYNRKRNLLCNRYNPDLCI